jgi:hypothetical protein
MRAVAPGLLAASRSCDRLVRFPVQLWLIFTARDRSCKLLPRLARSGCGCATRPVRQTGNGFYRHRIYPEETLRWIASPYIRCKQCRFDDASRQVGFKARIAFRRERLVKTGACDAGFVRQLHHSTRSSDNTERVNQHLPIHRLFREGGEPRIRRREATDMRAPLFRDNALTSPTCWQLRRLSAARLAAANALSGN